MPKYLKKRSGTTLQDRRAHAQDHESWSRRGFLRTIGLAGASSFGLASLPLTGLYGFPLAQAMSTANTNRKLVLIRLKGGNDGLNTIVPLYQYNDYQNFRPSLHHTPGQLIDLNEDFAMPTAMQNLQPLWEGGQMRVLNSVGYPDHNLSHFTSADIMASGNSNVAENGDGWLARYYTALNPDYIENPPLTPPAIKIGGPTSILFNDENKVDISANFVNAARLEEVASTGINFNAEEAPDECYYGDQVIFLRTIANAAARYSQAIFDAYTEGSNEVEYTSSLGEQLKLVARLIKGGLDTQLYLVTLDGFDTHVGQNGGGNHLGLLEDLSTAVQQFYQDLDAGNKDEEVLAMTYSEFGRRVQENSVSGTDHGTSLPILFFGPALNGSDTHGLNPDLTNLDVAGNLQLGTDFRSVYATVLENWLCIDPDTVDQVLGENYERLPDLGLSCGPVSTFQPTATSNALITSIAPLGGGQYRIDFVLPQVSMVQLEIFTLSGQRLMTYPSQRFPAGPNQVPLDLSRLPVGTVPLVYRLQAGGRVVSKQFVATNN
ncbi:MAG: DUF1501 domain-containing protein [Bacteroidota bacterium]